VRDTKYWRQLMEAGVEDDDVPDENEIDVEPLHEVVFPYELTERLLKIYEDPTYNRQYSVDVYREILLKLLRSVKYWRLDTPRWLPNRLRSLGAL